MRKGSLVVVGTGILTPAHLSQEAIGRIKTADVVYLLVPDPLGVSTIKGFNSNIINLADLYFDPASDKNGNNRQQAYDLMVAAVLDGVRQGQKVCAVFYGHPGVFVYPSHKSLEVAADEGFKVKMLPAISAEDCLFADLGIDPGDSGCQAYEASQYLFYQHKINPHSPMILWQIGVVGDETLTKFEPGENGVAMLTERLLETYPSSHLVTLYEATTLPIKPVRIETVSISELVKSEINAITTLFIPSLSEPKLNKEFCNRWNIDTEPFVDCLALK